MVYVSILLNKLVLDLDIVHLSEISNLKDPLFFYDDIATAIESHIESAQDKDGRRPLLISDPPWIASVIGSRCVCSHVWAPRGEFNLNV